MTYLEWFEAHAAKHAALITRLERQGLDQDAIIDYFDFERMRHAEPDFCPLYAQNVKCHETESLNCYFCACPHFRFDDAGMGTQEGAVRYSRCAIDAPEGRSYRFEAAIHQDCSCCLIPHRRAFIAARFDPLWRRAMAASLPSDRS